MLSLSEVDINRGLNPRHPILNKTDFVMKRDKMASVFLLRPAGLSLESVIS